MSGKASTSRRTKEDDDEDDDDDLFADTDSSDDDEPVVAAPTKKKAPPPPASKPNDSDDDSDGGDLFDSDSDDDVDDEDAKKKPKAAAEEKDTKPMSKRERLEALARKKKQQQDSSTGPKSDDEAKSPKDDAAKKEDEGGYDSGDSYDSAAFQRTQEDDDFLDTTGEDADAVQELYAEQHFDDERPDKEDSKKKKKRKHRDDDDDEKDEAAEPDNPIMAAVHRMKKKKREKKLTHEMEEEIRTLLGHMEMAAEKDETTMEERRPATHKLALLNTVKEACVKQHEDWQRLLLEMGILVVCKRWIQPLPPDGKTLGNVTVRQGLLQVISQMNAISASDLKRSEFGKVVMALYKHPKETPALKRLEKSMIEQWSRPIFQKSGNMRDLQHTRQQRGAGGLAAVRRHQQAVEARLADAPAAVVGGGRAAQHHQDLGSLIASGGSGKKGSDSGNRVRVPFSQGFSYAVQPRDRDVAKGPRGVASAAAAMGAKDPKRGNLNKRMLEKSRKVSKNQRSANISIEGRRVKP